MPAGKIRIRDLGLFTVADFVLDLLFPVPGDSDDAVPVRCNLEAFGCVADVRRRLIKSGACAELGDRGDC